MFKNVTKIGSLAHYVHDMKRDMTLKNLALI